MNTIIAAGESRSFIAVNGQSLWGCGNNIFARLGLGDTPHSLTFTRILVLAGDERIVQLVAGTYHTLALTSTGRLWGCGHNHSGQLGLGNTIEQHTFMPITIALADGEQITQLVAGDYYTLALTSAGRLWSCGNNSCGQLGLGDTTNRLMFTPITLALAGGERIVHLLTANNHTLALTSEGRLWGCGSNYSGELGLGDNIAPRTTFRPIVRIAHPAMSPFAAEVRPMAVAVPTRIVAAPEDEIVVQDSDPRHLCNIPDELFHYICSYLTLDSLRQLRQVCRRFDGIISWQYQQPVRSLMPKIAMAADDRIKLTDIMTNARWIYEHLPPAEQAAFRDEFLRCFPRQIGASAGLVRLVSGVDDLNLPLAQNKEYAIIAAIRRILSWLFTS